MLALPRGADHVGAPSLPDLYAEVPDAAGGCVDENPLTWFEPGSCRCDDVLGTFQSAGLTPAASRRDRPEGADLDLRALERDGLVTRAVYPTVPPRVEYGLTALGVEAGRLTAAIADWSVAHVKEIFAARDAYDVQATVDPWSPRLEGLPDRGRGCREHSVVP
jgi:hypothetical protein